MMGVRAMARVPPACHDPARGAECVGSDRREPANGVRNTRSWCPLNGKGVLSEFRKNGEKNPRGRCARHRSSLLCSWSPGTCFDAPV